MKGVLVVGIVSLFIFVNAETWSEWEDCSSGCYKRRSRTCEIDGSSSTGMKCADVGFAYEQELQTGCPHTNCSLGNALAFGSCLGNCYDASRDQTLQCANDVECNIVVKQRCYNETTCSVTWKQTDQTCSKSCGGGKNKTYRKCYDGDSPSYNCKGTGANVDYVDVQTTGDCNTEICPTWSSWTSITSCSRSCGGGSRTMESSCSYNGQPSLLCGDNKTSRTKPESCNTESCTITTMSTAIPMTETTTPSTTITLTTKSTTRIISSPKINGISTTKSPTSTLDKQKTSPTANVFDTTDGSPYNGPDEIWIVVGLTAVFIIIIAVIVTVWIRKYKTTDNVEINQESPLKNAFQEAKVVDPASDNKDVYAVVNKNRKAP